MTTYLLTLGTGQQARCTAKFLLAEGAKVRAVVRDPSNEAARQLERSGVVLIQGGLEDFDIFRNAAKGCTGIFLNLPLATDPDAERRQADGIVGACKDVGVETVVVSTAFFTGDKSKWDDEATEKDGLRDYYRRKSHMEEVVRSAGLRAYTIIRPAWFNANFLLPYAQIHQPDLASTGEVVHAFAPGATMSYIDEQDIGRYAAAALLNPRKFNAQEIDLGNDTLTPEEVSKILSRVSGRKVTARRRTLNEVEAAKASVPTQSFHLLANRVNFSIDGRAIEEKYGIPLTSFEEYMIRERTWLLASLPPQ